MKQFLKFALLLCVFVSCSIELRKPDPPADLVPEKEMVLLLEELMMIEYHLQSRYPRPEQFQECMKKSGQHLLSKRKISFERFDGSFTWYASDQEKMDRIYQQILDSMTAKMQKL